jgi:hypothetical protein
MRVWSAQQIGELACDRAHMAHARRPGFSGSSGVDSARRDTFRAETHTTPLRRDGVRVDPALSQSIHHRQRGYEVVRRRSAPTQVWRGHRVVKGATLGTTLAIRH